MIEITCPLQDDSCPDVIANLSDRSSLRWTFQYAKPIAGSAYKKHSEKSDDIIHGKAPKDSAAMRRQMIVDDWMQRYIEEGQDDSLDVSLD